MVMDLNKLKFWNRSSVTMEQLPGLVKQAMEARGSNPLVKQQIKELFKKDPARVMASIIRTQRTQYVKDMEEWQTAIFEARNIFNPQRVRLTEFYKDMENDPFIYGIAYNKRVLKISNKPYKIITGDKIDADKKKLLQKGWFNNTLKYAMWSRFWGHSLPYVLEMKGGLITKMALTYREHVIPDKNIFVKTQYDDTGFDYTQPPYSNYMLSIGEPEDLGLYEKIAIHYILKKHGWKNWDEFCEIFGIPMRIAKTATTDKKVLAEIEAWLQEMGSAPYGIFPQDAEMDIKESSQRDAFRVFLEKIQYANFEIEVLITGQNRVTQNGGSFAKEKEMGKEADEVTDDDKLFIYTLVNETILPFLTRLGYPFTEADEFQWDDAIREKPEERMDLFKSVNDMGFKVDPKQLKTEFGIEILGEKETSGSDPKPPKSKEKEPSNLKELIDMHNEISASYFATKTQK